MPACVVARRRSGLFREVRPLDGLENIREAGGLLAWLVPPLGMAASNGLDLVPPPAADRVVQVPSFADLAERTARVKRERQRLSKALADLGLEVLPSQANFVFVRFPQRSAREVHQALFQRRILVRHFDRPGLDDGLRITVGSPEQNDRLLEALADILRR